MDIRPCKAATVDGLVRVGSHTDAVARLAEFDQHAQKGWIKILCLVDDNRIVGMGEGRDLDQSSGACPALLPGFFFAALHKDLPALIDFPEQTALCRI